MSFQVNSTDLKHGTEITESVSTAEEEFKNSTDEETDRKLNPEDEEEFKKTRTEQSKRKLVPEDEDDDDEEQSCKSSTSVLFLWLCSSVIHLKTSLSIYHMLILRWRKSAFECSSYQERSLRLKHLRRIIILKLVLMKNTLSLCVKLIQWCLLLLMLCFFHSWTLSSFLQGKEDMLETINSEIRYALHTIWSYYSIITVLN